MEEAPENGKESPHSVHANGMIDTFVLLTLYPNNMFKLSTNWQVTIVLRTFNRNQERQKTFSSIFVPHLSSL